MSNDQPAFPHVVPDCGCGDSIRMNPGMSLRDYFAAKAMVGIMAASAVEHFPIPKPGEMAKDAYERADAMMKAREK